MIKRKRRSWFNITTAITGLVLSLTAEGYSPRTIETYRQHLVCLTDYLDNPELDNVTTANLREWLSWLRNNYRTRAGKKLTVKSVYNHWTSMRSFFNFLHDEGLIQENPALSVKAPRYHSPTPDPYTTDDIKKLIKACSDKRTKTFTQARNRAILVLLVDTGMRASELLGLNVNDIDLKRLRVEVLGKGNKKRYLPYGKTSQRYLWRYLAERGDYPGPLFLSSNGTRLSISTLDGMIRRLGESAGIPSCYPHRFRHTFAVNFLCNGGDSITLQQILGHSSMEMVARYVKMSNQNIDAIYRRSSPADKMEL